MHGYIALFPDSTLANYPHILAREGAWLLSSCEQHDQLCVMSVNYLNFIPTSLLSVDNNCQVSRKEQTKQQLQVDLHVL